MGGLLEEKYSEWWRLGGLSRGIVVSRPSASKIRTRAIFKYVFTDHCRLAPAAVEDFMTRCRWLQVAVQTLPHAALEPVVFGVDIFRWRQTWKITKKKATKQIKSTLSWKRSNYKREDVKLQTSSYNSVGHSCYYVCPRAVKCHKVNLVPLKPYFTGSGYSHSRQPRKSCYMLPVDVATK
jgi:hypothetical protein